MQIDYYLSLISPYCYLGGEQLADIAKKHGATVNVKPIDLSQVFPKTGGLPLAKRAPERQAYRFVELARWSKHLAMPLNLKPRFFPAAEGVAARMVLAMSKTGGDSLRLANAFGRAVWAEERDIADSQCLLDVARDCDLDGTALLEAAARTELEVQIEALTREAVERGVFGVPSYQFNGELFWGQDRLSFLDRALSTA
ncbi:2-hydroxychromene-2-carboxylate isomerase [Pelagibius sp. Alg239-R121]|uniref:2-hydroxychromene-2-carboxylate isomerase n=1 Tax=Pelagibius sp. Alg239-R121 TaxID=2993448 RepID=UPI0024A6B833|nr:2-hydroxychromene-2-carboxylate isomerase [Pelagibius sp. Alg239-R121]